MTIRDSTNRLRFFTRRYMKEFDKINNEHRRKLDRPITGIIQKDRIWEQWYDRAALEQPLPHMNQKDYLFSMIDDEPDRIIINNRGKKVYTVRQFHEMVDVYEKAFSSFHFEIEDVICTISLTTPEMYAIKYAATSLGLITCNLNILDVNVFDDGQNRLLSQLRKVKPKMIFTLDILEDKVSKILNLSEWSNVLKVRMPLDASMPVISSERIGLSFLMLKNRVKGNNVQNSLTLNDFLARGNKISKVPTSVYRKGLPCNIAFTSGTTGINKAVLISHDANNALAFQHSVGGFGWKKGTEHLALIPPFLAIWDADIVHTTLCLGAKNIIELNLDYQSIPKYFQHFKSNMGVWSQYLWSSLLTLPEKELSGICEQLQYVIIGGERCDYKTAKHFFEKTGIVQMTGYGATEVNSAFTLTQPNCVKMGTAGLPLPFNNLKIVDEDFNDLTYDQAGRLLITGPCLMNGYLNQQDLTKQVLIKDKEGIIWYDTHDYAILDRDGCLTVLDRDMPSVEVCYKNKTYRIKLLDVNEIINKNDVIQICKTDAIEGKIILYCVIDTEVVSSIDAAAQNIIKMCREDLSEEQQPDIIYIMESFPRTAVGKVDYKTLNNAGQRVVKQYKNNYGKLYVIREK